MYIIMHHDIIIQEKEREHVYKTLTFSRSFLCTYTFSKPTLTFHCYAKKNNYTLMLSLTQNFDVNDEYLKIMIPGE